MLRLPVLSNSSIDPLGEEKDLIFRSKAFQTVPESYG